MNKVLSISIPTWNRANYLSALLNSIQIQFEKDTNLKDIVKIYVFDNDSKDNTSEVVQSSDLEIIYIKNNSNIGGDLNIFQAYTSVEGEYVWVVGDDEIISDGAINYLLRIIDRQAPGLIICRNQGLMLLPTKIKTQFDSGEEFFNYYKDTYPPLLLLHTLMSINVIKNKIINPDFYLSKLKTTCFSHSCAIALALNQYSLGVTITETDAIYVSNNRADIARTDFHYIRVKLYEYIEWLKIEYKLSNFNPKKVYLKYYIKLMLYRFKSAPILTIKLIYSTLCRETRRLICGK